MTYFFKGFQRSDGTVGTRNHIGVVSSVICSSIVVREIAEQLPQAVPFVHANGCAQLGDDFQLTKSILVGVTKNPNLYSSLLVGLGCETNQIDGMLEDIPETKPVKGITIQNMSGSKNTINDGVRIAKEWIDESVQEQRQLFPLSELSVGIITVDADEQCLKQSAPIMGKVVDQLLENNANVVFGLSKTLEPAGQILASRTENKQVQENFQTLSKGMRRNRWEKSPDETTSLQIWSEEEKNLASLETKLLGTKTIDGLIDYGSHPETNGFHMMRVPNNIVEALSGMASAGCGITFMVSSRGVLVGSVAFPTITVAPENDENFSDDLVDYVITNDDATQQASQVLQKLIDVCSGEESKLEEFELGEFSIGHSGTTY